MRVVHEAAPPAYGRCPWLFTTQPELTASVGLVLLSWWSRGRKPLISWHAAKTPVLARDGWDHVNIRLANPAAERGM